MNSLDCWQLADAAPELALGILPGDERADAIAHLDECGHCQQLVGSLTMVTDRLLLLGTRAEPPPGFERRVLAAVTAPERPVGRINPPHPTARRRIPGAVLAVAACVIAVFITLGVAARPSGPSVAAAEMRTDGGDLVGEIFVHDGPPTRVFMHLPGWDATVGRYGSSTDGYSLLITRDVGPALLVPVTMSGNSTWAASVDVDPDSIRSASLLDRTGRVWCSGTF